MTIYDDLTMFHHFSKNDKVTRIICRKYKKLFYTNKLSEYEKSLPLLLFYKNKEGKNALDLAREDKNYSLFIKYIQLLTLINQEHLFTRHMIANIEFMIKMESQTIYDFFNNCHYQPLLM